MATCTHLPQTKKALINVEESKLQVKSLLGNFLPPHSICVPPLPPPSGPFPTLLSACSVPSGISPVTEFAQIIPELTTAYATGTPPPPQTTMYNILQGYLRVATF